MDWLAGAKAFFWCYIALECIGVIGSALAIAVDLPPTKTEIGNGLRIVRVLSGSFGVWFLWNILDKFIK